MFCQASSFELSSGQIPRGAAEPKFLLPPSVQEWLPETRPVYLMLGILEELDISAIDEKY